MKRIGIYAGTFDPVHNGHLMFALGAASVCELDKVIFLPEREPRGKTNVTDYAHRVAMIKLAIKGHTKLALKELKDRQFSVRTTLPELLDMHKGQRLTLLIGSDNALSMNPTTWPGVEQLYKTADIAVGMRDTHARDDLQDMAAKARHVTFIFTNHPHVAATKVRGGSVDMVKPAVRDYITKHHLYGT